MRTLLIQVGARSEVPDPHYPVRLYFDDGGVDWLKRPRAEASMPSTLSPPEQPLLNGEVATPERIRQFVLAHGHESEKFAEIGTYLYGLLACDAVGKAWQDLARQHAGRGPGQEGLRLLLDIEPRELRQLPWEMMRSAQPLPLFADERNPCARAYHFDSRDRGIDDCWPPLRLLVVVGSKPEDDAVEAPRELDHLREALSRLWGLVELEILDRPSQPELRASYLNLKPHIFHFIGHGTEGQAGVALEIAPRDGDDGWAWDTTAIAADLQGWRPRLAIINACRSMELAGQERAWQIVDAFAQFEIPAVIGMQGDVRGDAAAAFASGFYRALVSDRPVDVALSASRVAMSHKLGWGRRDVFLPCLMLSVPPERVFPRYGVTPQQRRAIEQTKAFEKVYRFVDRTTERRRLWRAVGAESQDDGEAVVLAVIGEGQVGKSELVKWCLGANAMRGANVAYVDFSRSQNLEFLSALGVIAEELAASAIHGATNAEALDQYVAEVDRLLESPAAPPRQTTSGPGRYHRTFRPGAEDLIPSIFDYFLNALKSAAGERSLILALDNITNVEPAHWRQYICQNLIEPVALQQTVSPRLRLIVVVDPSAVDTALTPNLRGVTRVELRPYSKDQYVELMTQYLRAGGFLRADFEGLLKALALSPRPTWKAEWFDELDRIARLHDWQQEPP